MAQNNIDTSNPFYTIAGVRLKGMTLAVASVYLHLDYQHTNFQTKYALSKFVSSYKGNCLMEGV